MRWRWPSGNGDDMISPGSCTTATEAANIRRSGTRDWLEEIGAMRSVGSRGDSYDNVLAEAVNGLYKAEVIHKSGPWRSLDQVEFATAKWVHWWNHKGLHGAVGDMP